MYKALQEIAAWLLGLRPKPDALARGAFVWLLIGVFTTAYIQICYFNVVHLRNGIDLGTYTQLLWNVNQGNIPPFNTIKNQVAWGDHAHFAVAVLGPLFSLAPSPLTVLVLQIVIVTTSAWAIYALARRLVGGFLFPLAVTVSYLAFFGVQYALDFDFHANTLTAAVFAWSLYAFYSGRLPLYWLLLALGVTTREDAATFYAMFGVFLLLAHHKRHWRIALTTIGISTVYFFLVAYVVMPMWQPSGTPLAYFDAPTETHNPVEIALWLLSNPITVWQNMTETSLARRTLHYLFRSFGYLPLASPATYLLALPNILARFLSPEEQRHMMKFHYSVSLAPILSFGTILTVALAQNVARKVTKRFLQLISILATSIVLAGTYATSWTDIDLPLRQLLVPDLFAARYRNQPGNGLLLGVKQMIPDTDSVASVGSLVPTLATRSEIYVLPDGLDADWIVLPTKFDSWPLAREDVGAMIRALRAGGRHEEVTSFNGMYVFRKVR